MHGLLQIISLMLALGGFGVSADKQAPSADTVLAYAVDDADAILYADVAAIAPANYKVLVALADDDAVKADADLLALAKKVKTNLEGARGMVKAVVGVDVVEDISSITVFVDLEPGVAPARMAVIRGSLPHDVVDKLAKVAGGTTGTIDGRTTLAVDADTFVGTTEDGALVVGPKALVEPRVADDWKAPKRKKGSAWATIAKYLDAKPFALVAAKPDEQDAAAYAKELGTNFLADLVRQGAVAVLALHHDGLALSWQDRDADHLERVAMAVDGALDLMRAGQIAPRALLKLALAAIDSYAGANPALDELIAHKGELEDVVEAYSGDGTFKVKRTEDAKAHTLTVRATGKKLSDVVPTALLVPALAAGFLFADDESAAPPPPPARKPRRTHLQPLPTAP